MHIKRKATTAKTLKRTLKTLTDETWIYGNGKLSHEEYLKVDAVSSSQIKDIYNPKYSDLYLYHKYIKKDLEKESTPAQVMGRAFHTLTLEPELFDDQFASLPKIDKRTKQGKADYAEWLKNNGDKQQLTGDQLVTIKAMADSVKNNPFAMSLLKGTQKEVSAFTRHSTGLVTKARADAINFKGRYVVDLKSVADISPQGFAKAVSNFRYDIQQEHYKKMFNVDDFVFICTEKEAPFETAIYVLNTEFEMKAAEDVNYAMSHWSQITKDNVYNGFTNKQEMITMIEPPQYYKYI